MCVCAYDSGRDRKVDLSKLKRHRGAKDAQELEDILSGYAQQMKTLQGEIDQMQPNMKVGGLVAQTLSLC